MVKAEAGILESDTQETAGRKLHLAVANVIQDSTEARWVESELKALLGLIEGGETSSSDMTTAAWRRFLEALGEHRPAVLVFEDLHWPDDGLLDFLDDLVDWLSDVRCW
jgi:predicted ATPase